ALLVSKNWPSAYYLGGYAVECGLKSCILARVAAAPEVIFIEKGFSQKCWTHDIEDLVKLAGLDVSLVADAAANALLETNWLIAKDWTEELRYQMKTQKQAED